jgi:hypothetical protein
VARITYNENPDARKTAITLQDACFGAGALMRIAAMFVRPNAPGAVQDISDIQLQATPVSAVADTVNVPVPLSEAEAAPPHRYTIVSAVHSDV